MKCILCSSETGGTHSVCDSCDAQTDNELLIFAGQSMAAKAEKGSPAEEVGRAAFWTGMIGKTNQFRNALAGRKSKTF